MSAPNTDTDKQERRHKVPLMGITLAMVWAAVLLVALIVYLSWSGNEPGNDVPIDEEGKGQQSDADGASG